MFSYITRSWKIRQPNETNSKTTNSKTTNTDGWINQAHKQFSSIFETVKKNIEETHIKTSNSL